MIKRKGGRKSSTPLQPTGWGKQAPAIVAGAIHQPEIRTYPKIIKEPQFECVRLRRIHSKCELFLNFRIDTEVLTEVTGSENQAGFFLTRKAAIRLAATRPKVTQVAMVTMPACGNLAAMPASAHRITSA